MVLAILPMADPGFPVGGGGGGWTPDTGDFWRKCMQKRKDWVHVGGACAGHAPLDPPMFRFRLIKLKNNQS